MARSFDGTGDYIVLANESNFDFTQSTTFSVFLWVRFTGVASTYSMVSKLNVSAPNEGWEFYQGVATDELHVYQINTFPTNETLRDTTNANVPATTWLCLGFTYDGAGNNNAAGVTIYKNGTPPTLGTTANTLTGSILNNKSVTLGSRETTGIQLNGQEAFVVIWNSVLSANSIKAMANGVNPFVLDFSNQVCDLPLDGNNSPESDFIKQTNKGTVTNATKYAGNPAVNHLSCYISGFC